MKDILYQCWVLMRCAAYALVHGRATRLVAQPKTVCVVQVAQLGDMVCTTPLFRAIKIRYPAARLVVVGTAANRGVLAGNPHVDEYVAWEGSSIQMAHRLHACALDFACVTNPNASGLAALYLAGVPHIVAPRIVGGVCPTDAKAYRLLRLLANVVSYTFGSYTPREYLRLLEPIGINTSDTRKQVFYTDAAAARVVEKLRAVAILPSAVSNKTAFAIIAPSAGNKIKRWPPERFARVAEYVARRMPVVVVGATADKEEVAEMFAHVSSPRVYNFCEQTSLDELKALIARARLFISGDTGPLYIAEALGVPTIDIVGPVSERDQPPNNPPRHIVIAPPRDAPAMHALNSRIHDAAEVHRQAAATTVAEVVAAIDVMLLHVVPRE